MTQGRDFATCPPSAPPCSTRRLASWPAACTTRRRRAPEAPDGDKPLHDWYRTRNDQAGRLDPAVAGKAGGGCAGEAVLNQWDPGNDSRNFRILIGPDGRDRGLGTEATRLIVGYGFERLGLHRVSLEVYAFNPRARRAYEKAGFRAEGILRESLRYNGERADATVTSIPAREWRHGAARREDSGSLHVS